MGQEQERSKELPNQFPKIPEEIIDSITQRVRGVDLDKVLIQVSTEEPALKSFIETLVRLVPESRHFQVGFLFACLVFKELKKEGYSFPKVTKGTVDGFLNEYFASVRQLTPLKKSVRSFENLVEIVRIGRKSTEFTYPRPSNYTQENPALIKLLGFLEPRVAAVGAIFLYELKRRQFHADQLAKQFGE